MEFIASRLWRNENNHDSIYGLYYSYPRRELLSVYGRNGKKLLFRKKRDKSIADFSEIRGNKQKRGYFELQGGQMETSLILRLDEFANGIDGFHGVLKQSLANLEKIINNPFGRFPLDGEVKCVLNHGLNGFELGVTYLFKGVESNELIYVEDMEGIVQKVMADRFKACWKKIEEGVENSSSRAMLVN